MTALEAGAFLGDARAAPHLIQLARTGTPGVKTQAIRLLTKMPSNPQINLALRDLVNSDELDVRVAAWEGLSERNDPSVTRWSSWSPCCRSTVLSSRRFKTMPTWATT